MSLEVVNLPTKASLGFEDSKGDQTINYTKSGTKQTINGTQFAATTGTIKAVPVFEVEAGRVVTWIYEDLPQDSTPRVNITNGSVETYFEGELKTDGKQISGTLKSSLQVGEVIAFSIGYSSPTGGREPVEFWSHDPMLRVTNGGGG